MGRLVSTLNTFDHYLLCQYPAYDSFVKEVKEEAEANVKRLRHHPSIVIFGMFIRKIEFCIVRLQTPQAGNNEGDTNWQNEG